MAKQVKSASVKAAENRAASLTAEAQRAAAHQGAMVALESFGRVKADEINLTAAIAAGFEADYFDIAGDAEKTKAVNAVYQNKAVVSYINARRPLFALTDADIVAIREKGNFNKLAGKHLLAMLAEKGKAPNDLSEEQARDLMLKADGSARALLTQARAQIGEHGVQSDGMPKPAKTATPAGATTAGAVTPDATKAAGDAPKSESLESGLKAADVATLVAALVTRKPVELAKIIRETAALYEAKAGQTCHVEGLNMDTRHALETIRKAANEMVGANA